jgi:hypothetical protein
MWEPMVDEEREAERRAGMMTTRGLETLLARDPEFVS